MSHISEALETMDQAGKVIDSLVESNNILLAALERISDIYPAGEECVTRSKRGACGCIGCIARKAISLSRVDSRERKSA